MSQITAGVKSEEVGLNKDAQVGCRGHGLDTFHERSSFVLLNEFVNKDKDLSNSDILDLANLDKTEDKSITPSIADTPLLIYDYFRAPIPGNIDSKRFVDIRGNNIKASDIEDTGVKAGDRLEEKSEWAQSKGALNQVPTLYDLALAKYREKTALPEAQEGSSACDVVNFAFS